MRLQKDIDLLSKKKFLSPQYILETKQKTLSKNFPDNELKNSIVEELYYQIDLVDWKEAPKDSTEEFLLFVRNFRSGKFRELADYVIFEPMGPDSNASIERVFSISGSIKTIA